MTNMIEKVARALFDAGLPGCGTAANVSVRWEDHPRRQDVSRVLARAAIEAMREPTPEMLDGYCDPRNDAMKQAVAAEWRAMIAEALK